MSDKPAIEISYARTTVKDAKGDEILYANLVSVFMKSAYELMKKEEQSGLIRGGSIIEIFSQLIGTIFVNIPEALSVLMKDVDLIQALKDMVALALNSTMAILENKDKEVH